MSDYDSLMSFAFECSREALPAYRHVRIVHDVSPTEAVRFIRENVVHQLR